MRKTAILLALACALARADYGPGTTDSDLLRSGTPVVTNAWLAVSNDTARLIAGAKNDASLITDGTNTIDAAGNVYEYEIASIETNYWNSTLGVLGLETWDESDGQAVYASWTNQSARIYWMSGGWGCYTNDYYLGEVVGTPYDSSVIFGNLVFSRQLATNRVQQIVGKVALTNDIPDVSGYATQQQATNAAVAVADAKISTNNAAFVSAVTNCPVSHQGGGGADWPIGDFGQYGTIGAIIAALVAASTWLKSHLRYELHDVVLTGGAGTLLDRAGNRVVVSGDTTLTLPAANPGYLRDFIVRLEISGSTVPTITFAAPTGETLTYETDGDEFPVPDEAGDWLYSFTESCVAHTFAVSLKKVNSVAQGGA